MLLISQLVLLVSQLVLLFSIWVFFHVHSRFTGQQGKGEAIYLTPLYRFHSFHRHLNINWVITAESSPLHIASSRTGTGNLWITQLSMDLLEAILIIQLIIGASTSCNNLLCLLLLHSFGLQTSQQPFFLVGCFHIK